jgi:hypothetical protein
VGHGLWSTPAQLASTLQGAVVLSCSTQLACFLQLHERSRCGSGVQSVLWQQ